MDRYASYPKNSDGLVKVMLDCLGDTKAQNKDAKVALKLLNHAQSFLTEGPVWQNADVSPKEKAK